MQINIAICDDEIGTLEKIKNKVLDIASARNVSVDVFTYSDANRVVDVLCNNKERIDVLLLDIDMPKLSGLEVAKLVRKYKENIILIFISAHEQYVFESIEYSPFRYIRKNKISEELPLAMKAAFSRLEADRDRSIIVKTEGGEKRLYYSEIMYYETEARKLKIHQSSGKILSVWKTIKEFSSEINDERFIQLHSGCVVNVKYISEFSNYDVTLDNGERLIVSRRRVKDVKEELVKYWRGKM